MVPSTSLVLLPALPRWAAPLHRRSRPAAPLTHCRGICTQLQRTLGYCVWTSSRRQEAVSPPLPRAEASETLAHGTPNGSRRERLNNVPTDLPPRFSEEKTTQGTRYFALKYGEGTYSTQQLEIASGSTTVEWRTYRSPTQYSNNNKHQHKQISRQEYRTPNYYKIRRTTIRYEDKKQNVVQQKTCAATGCVGKSSKDGLPFTVRFYCLEFSTLLAGLLLSILWHNDWFS